MGRHGAVAIGQYLASQRDGALVGRLEAGDQPQQGGLAATGRADDGGPAAAGDGEVDTGKSLDRAIALVHVTKFKKAHRPAIRFDWT